MELVVTDVKAYEDWAYNLTLVAPGKAEARKTVSNGVIRIGSLMTDGPMSSWKTFGLATDDIMSISAVLEDAESPMMRVSWVTVDALNKPAAVNQKGDKFYISIDEIPVDEDFDTKFWIEHVSGSIYDAAWKQEISKLRISPDRLRKFSLLKPRGNPVNWKFHEWADRDIIRFEYGESVKGVYVPMDTA